MKGKFLKIALVLIATVLTVLILVCAGLIAYAGFAEKRAEKKAREFCSSTSTGMATTGLVERAMENGADRRLTRWIKSENHPDLLAVTFAGFLLSRHVCSITAVQGKVTKAEYAYLD